jgi:hypothetical protein
MRKLIALSAGLAVVSTSALAQVTPVAMVSTALTQSLPENCLPVFPLADDLAQVQPVQGDVIADRAIPAAEGRRGIFGLPLLPFLLAAGAGGLGLTALGGDDAGPAALASPQ